MYFAYWVGIISSSNRISSCFLSLLLKAKKRIMVVINKSKSTVEFVLQHIHCKMLHLCTVFILTLLILSSAKLWCLPIQSKKHHENSLKKPKNANEHHSRTYFVLVLRQTKVVKVRFNLQKLFCWRHSCSESTPWCAEVQSIILKSERRCQGTHFGEQKCQVNRNYCNVFFNYCFKRDESFFPTWNEIRTGVCWSAGWVMRNNFLPLIMRKLKHFIRSIFLIFVLLRITWSSFHRKWLIAFDSVYSDYINLKKKAVTVWIWEKSKKVLENHWHKCFWIFIKKSRKNSFPNM